MLKYFSAPCVILIYSVLSFCDLFEICNNFVHSPFSRRQKLSKTEKGQPQGHGSKHHHRKGPSGSGTRAKSLVKLVMPLSSVKEDVYQALDTWAAFELEFPVVAVRKALQRLKQQGQWQRIIQVCKWMLLKGQGQTLGTYNLMLKAYDMDARLEEAEALWKKILAIHTRSMPRIMFVHMMSIYKRREMPEKILEVFKQMRKVGVKPDGGTLKRVGEVYKQLGMPEKQVELLKKYSLPTWKYYHAKGKTMRVLAASGAMDFRAEDILDSVDVSQRVQPEFNVCKEIPNIPDSGGLHRRADSKINVDYRDSVIPASVDNSGKVNLKINEDKKKSEVTIDHEDFIKEIIATM